MFNLAPDAPPPRLVTTRQWIGTDLIHVVSARFARADRGLKSPRRSRGRLTAIVCLRYPNVRRRPPFALGSRSMMVNIDSGVNLNEMTLGPKF